MKRKKYFTLVEIIIVVIIVGLLATFAIPGYHNMVERAKAKVCESNLNVLLGAVKIYALENDQLPGTLGQMKQKYLEKSWARYFKIESRWKIKLAYFLVDLKKRGAAYAQASWLERYVGDIKYFICPADDTPPPQGYSYGINSNLAGITYDQYKSLPDDTVVISDSDSASFPPVAKRHKKYKPLSPPITYAIKITKSGHIISPLQHGYDSLDGKGKEHGYDRLDGKSKKHGYGGSGNHDN